jgi:hypothetical protein
MVFLRPLRYGKEVSKPADGVFGAGAHTDYVSGWLVLDADESNLPVPCVFVCL